MSSSFTDDTIDPNRDFTIRRNTNYRSTRFPTSLSKRGESPEIKSMHQLSFLEKMMVTTAFRNGVVKFIKMWQMQDFIYLTTKINISTKLLFEVRRKDIQEKYTWYYNFARDSAEYIVAYTRAIDEIDMYKEELWKIILYNSKDNREKIEAFKELHNLTKSGVIMLKELPFLTQLSKFYDISKLDPNRYGIGRLQYDKYDKYERGLPNLETNHYVDTYDRNNSNDAIAMHERIRDKHFESSNSSNSNSKGPRQDMVDDLLSQIPELKQQKEAEKAGDEYLQRQLKEVDKEMQNIINATDMDETKKASQLDNLKKKYYETMSRFEDVISPDKRNTINMLKSLEDKDNDNNDQL
jgi:hypothetical protein